MITQLKNNLICSNENNSYISNYKHKKIKKVKLSDIMSNIIQLLKESLDTKIILLQHKFYENKTIEFIETNMFLFHLVTHHDGGKILNININMTSDLNDIVRLGLLLSNFYDDYIQGFKFLDSYITIDGKDKITKFLYGEDAEDVINIMKFEEIYRDKMHDTLLKNVDIDNIPCC